MERNRVADLKIVLQRVHGPVEPTGSSTP